MRAWHPVKPTPSAMGDHDVPRSSEVLKGQRIALIVCGGIAAMKTPTVARALRRLGATVMAYVTSESLRYVGKEALEWSTVNPVIDGLSYKAEHLSKDLPFNAYLVAPATYNTINKMRYGIADTPVTSVLATAIGLMEKGLASILIAPTMHGDMHNSILQESLEILASKGITLIPPRDDYGKHNLSDSDVIAAFVSATLSTSPIRNKRVLVTAGSTPTYIDDVRFISNKFLGHLGIQIASELCLRGVEVELVLGPGSIAPPAYITTTVIKDYEDYKSCVLAKLRADAFDYGVFSAAVADYKPKARVAGKIPSTGLSNIALEPTAKVIDLVQKAFPTLKILTFKFQLNIAHEDLIKIAAQRVRQGHIGVMANRGEERGPNGEHIAHLVDRDLKVRTFMSKEEIAIGICDYMEEIEIKRE